jgi:hypothetical protein
MTRGEGVAEVVEVLALFSTSLEAQWSCLLLLMLIIAAADPVVTLGEDSSSD